MVEVCLAQCASQGDEAQNVQIRDAERSNERAGRLGVGFVASAIRNRNELRYNLYSRNRKDRGYEQGVR